MRRNKVEHEQKTRTKDKRGRGDGKTTNNKDIVYDSVELVRKMFGIREGKQVKQAQEYQLVKGHKREKC